MTTLHVDDVEWERFGKAVDALHWTSKPVASVPTTPPDGPGLVVRTPAEIATTAPDRPEFLGPYVVKGSILELTGYAKKGKTSFLSYLIGCIVHGVDCLDQTTQQVGVLWLTEERLPTFVATLSRAGLLQAPSLHVASRWDSPPAMTWPHMVAEAVEKCRSLSCGVLVVDTLPAWAGLRGDKENNAGDALEALEPLQRAAASGLAVIIVRHDRKGGGAVGESGRGSSAFAGAVDTLIALRQPEGQGHPNRRVLQAISRFDDVPETLVIERTIPDSVSPEPQGSRFGKHFYRVVASTDRVAEAAESAILSALVCPKTVDELLAALPALSRTTITNALRRLDCRGVQRTGTGVKGSPHRYQRAGVSFSTSSPETLKE